MGEPTCAERGGRAIPKGKRFAFQPPQNKDSDYETEEGTRQRAMTGGRVKKGKKLRIKEDARSRSPEKIRGHG